MQESRQARVAGEAYVRLAELFIKRISKLLGIFLEKDAVSDYSDSQQIALIQLLRLINSLRSWMTNLNSLVRAKEVYTCDALEIYYVICANYYEACKTFFKDVYPEFGNLRIESILKKEIEFWENEWNEYRSLKEDTRYKVIDLLRNTVAFHYKDEFIKNNFKEGSDEADIQIGFTTDGKMGTTRFSLFMNYILAEIKKIVGDELLIDGYIDFLNKKILKDLIDKRCLVLEHLAMQLIGDKLYTKEDQA